MKILKDNRALESSEFAVMLATIVVVVYVAFQLLGGNITQFVITVADRTVVYP